MSAVELAAEDKRKEEFAKLKRDLDMKLLEIGR